MPALIKFTWFRFSDGFEFRDAMEQFVTREGPIRALFPKGERIDGIRPLDDNPALFLEFSSTPLTESGIAEFASKYGPLYPILSDVSPDEIEAARMKKGELDRDYVDVNHLGFWQESIKLIRRGIRLYEKSGRDNEFKNFTRWFNNKIAEQFQMFPDRAAFSVDVRLSTVEDPPGVQTFMQPRTLLAAMWLQFGQHASSDKGYQSCLRCGAWFIFGTGTGRRKSGHYCSDACRKAAFNARKEQGK